MAGGRRGGGSRGVAGSLALLVLAAAAQVACAAAAGHDYGTALSKSILYFEAQRSGRLPGGQRVAWRANSGLLDGKANGVRSRKSNLIDHKSRPAPLGNGIFA